MKNRAEVQDIRSGQSFKHTGFKVGHSELGPQRKLKVLFEM